MRRIAVAVISLLVLAGCGGTGSDEARGMSCPEWASAFDTLFQQTEPFATDAFAAANDAYTGAASPEEATARVEASAEELKGIVAQIEVLGTPPQHLSTAVAHTLESLDLGIQGYEKLAAGRRADDMTLKNEGGVLLAQGVNLLDTARVEKEAAGTCS